jgi:bisphosphoglycerate-dependent phosphoglycerate mutase
MWSLLHGLAERAGRLNNDLQKADERRAWDALFKSLEKGIPCEHCRKHYGDWYAAQKPVLPEDYGQFRDYVRKWLYDLHENVNQNTKKSSFPYEKLAVEYKDKKIQMLTNQLRALVKTNVMGGSVPILAWTAFLNNALKIKSIYGI